MQDPASVLLWMIDRIDGACVIQTDRSGVFTHFGPGAEAIFGVPAAQAIGKLHYQDFHDPEELRACHGDPEFKRLIETRGWTEDLWRVIPRAGEPFTARVTLAPLPAPRPAETASNPLDNPISIPQNQKNGWIALYRRVG